MNDLRSLLMKSWEATLRRTDVHGAVQLNHASAAGKCLHLAGGDARLARSLLPKDDVEFWAVVATYLDLLIDQEREQEEASLKTGT